MNANDFLSASMLRLLAVPQFLVFPLASLASLAVNLRSRRQAGLFGQLRAERLSATIKVHYSSTEATNDESFQVTQAVRCSAHNPTSAAARRSAVTIAGAFSPCWPKNTWPTWPSRPTRPTRKNQAFFASGNLPSGPWAPPGIDFPHKWYPCAIPQVRDRPTASQASPDHSISLSRSSGQPFPCGNELCQRIPAIDHD